VKTKVVRLALAGLAVIVGFVVAIIMAKPPHQMTVAVVKVAVPAGTPFTDADLTTESVNATWAQAAHLLTPAEAVGFESAVTLPVGVPIPATDRWKETIGSGNVALPLTIAEGNAEGVEPGSIVAVYKTETSGVGAGALIGTGVHVLSVDVPSGTPNAQTDEVVVIDIPASYAASLVGNSVVLALMSGNPATQWMGASSTPASSLTTSAASGASASGTGSTGTTSVHSHAQKSRHS
jgi:hypothetical protein